MSAPRISTSLVIGLVAVLVSVASSCGRGGAGAEMLQCSSGASAPTSAPTPQLVLATGPFPRIEDARLGVPIKFENEVDTTSCFPLLVSDIVVAWLAHAHVAAGELLVNRCVEYDPSIEQTAGNRHGGALEVWERVRLSADKLSLVTTPLGAIEWGLFSNPSFCGTRVAYWGLQKDGRLSARIFDVTSSKEVASRSIGTVMLETDARDAFARPRWNAQCSSASFSAEPFVRGTWTLP